MMVWLTEKDRKLSAPLAGHKRAIVINVSALVNFLNSLGDWHLGSLCRLTDQLNVRLSHVL